MIFALFNATMFVLNNPITILCRPSNVMMDIAFQLIVVEMLYIPLIKTIVVIQSKCQQFYTIWKFPKICRSKV